MKEIRDIINAYSSARHEELECALATVVRVEGSSYRQPGARMLVTSNGNLTGAISGGCLEGDALRKALLCISQKQNKLITYDTSSDDDAEFGVQLGCNGIVHILFEYIDFRHADNPVELLSRVAGKRCESVTLTVFSPDRNRQQPGTILYCKDEVNLYVADARYKSLIAQSIETLFQRRAAIKEIEIDGENFHGLFQFHEPALSLVIAGAGNDVMPLVSIASAVGWDVTVADGRASHARVLRFPAAAKVLNLKAQNVLEHIEVDARTFFVLMTHNYQYDLVLLKQLLRSNVAYIGILGPKSKFQRMEDDLLAERIFISDADKQRIFNPVGLDIGAETSEEIAISVIAEIQAFVTGSSANPLRLKQGKIHDLKQEAL